MPPRARHPAQRRALGFLPLDGLSSLNPASALDPASASNPSTNSFAGAQTSNPNPGLNTVMDSQNGVAPSAGTNNNDGTNDPDPAAFLSKLAGTATQGLNSGGLNSGFNNKRSLLSARTGATIPGFTGPNIEADIPANLVPTVPHARRDVFQRIAEQRSKRFIQNADYAEAPAQDQTQTSDVLKAVDANANANAQSQPERRFIRNADYQAADAPASAANSVIAEASAAEAAPASV